MPHPQFIVIGAHKSGTTSLHHYLNQHPDLYLPAQKGSDLLWRTKCETLTEAQAYLDQFATAPPGAVCGEVSSVYLHKAPAQARRIHQLFPDVKLIAVLRNPIERAYAHGFWGQTYRPEELARVDEIIQNSPRFLNPGRYTTHLSQYFNYFAREQVQVLTYDAFCGDGVSFIQEIYQFIGVDGAIAPDTETRYNVSTVELDNAWRRWLLRGLAAPQVLKQWIPQGVRSRLREAFTTRSNPPKPPMSEPLRQFLTDYYREEVLGLRDLVGLDCAHWLSEPDSEGSGSNSVAGFG